MKKLICLLCACLIFATYAVPAYAAGEGAYPKILLQDYTTAKAYQSPGETFVLTMTLHNTHGTRGVKNLVMSATDPAGEILPVGAAQEYLSAMAADETYSWTQEFLVAPYAADKPHVLTISLAYEDTRGNPLTAQDSAVIYVRQETRLSCGVPQLSAQVTQGDTPSFSITLMNMGKGTIRNALITADLPGLADGVSVLVGNLASGESKDGKLNLRVDSAALGDTSGTVTVTYEYEYGETYTKTLPISTTVREKVVLSDTSQAEAEEEKFPWKHAAIAALASSGLLLLILIVSVIRRARQDARDAMRL